MANTIQVKRGAFASLPTLADGEFGFSDDTFQLHIGKTSVNHEVLMHQIYNANTFLYATSDNTPVVKTRAEVMGILSGQASADFAMNTHKITGVTDPTSAQDAATKAYVDATSSGLHIKASCRVTTTAVLPACTPAGSGVGKTLTGNANAVLTIDGVATVLNNRVLVKNQAAGDDNGIYKVTTEGTAGAAFVLTRATDFDTNTEVTAGAFTFVSEGTVNADQGWVLSTNDPITVDTTALAFSQFSGAGTITAGTGMTKTGDTLNVIGGTGITANADDIAISTNGVNDTHIDWGTGANQVSAVDVPIADAAAQITATDVEGALTEIYDITELNTTHRTSNGSDHGYIDQSVVSGASPSFISATLTTPVLNTSISGTAFLDEDNMVSDSAVKVCSQQSIKAYVDTQIATTDTLAEVLAIGNTTGGTNIEYTTTDKAQFRDAAIYINSSVDGQLDIVADTEIQIAATTIDINGAVALNGAITGATTITMNGALDGATIDGGAF